MKDIKIKFIKMDIEKPLPPKKSDFYMGIFLCKTVWKMYTVFVLTKKGVWLDEGHNEIDSDMIIEWARLPYS